MSYHNPNSSPPPPYGYYNHPRSAGSVPRVVIPPPPPPQHWLPPQYQQQHHQQHHQQLFPQAAHYSQPYPPQPPPPQHFYHHQSQQPEPVPGHSPQPSSHFYNPDPSPLPPAPSLGQDGHVSPSPLPPPQQPSRQAPAKLKRPPLDSPQAPHDSEPRPLPNERLVLLALSDEYLDAARLVARSAACTSTSELQEQYNRLVALSLACLETVCTLTKTSLTPRQVALPRLKYAALLYEETVEHARVESVLDKTIRLCETNHLLDLMQTARHYQVRSYLRHSRELAIKSLDDYVRQCTSYMYHPWVYAFRFLRVSASLRHFDLADVNNALKHLRELTKIANERSDHAIAYTASIFEAMVWLRAARTDSNENVHRCLATARALQNRVDSQKLPQLQILLHLADIATTLAPYDSKRAQECIQPLQEMMRSRLTSDDWQPDGTFEVPFRLQPGDAKLVGDTAGIFRSTENSVCCLRFSWLSVNVFRAISCLVSAVAFSSTAATASQKSEAFLSKALEYTSIESIAQDVDTGQSVPTLNSSLTFNHELRAVILTQLAHVSCAHSAWESALNHVVELDSALHSLPAGSSPLRRTLDTASTYLRGLIAQGQGQLDAALSFYQQPALNLQQPSFPQPEAQRLYSLLAAFNTVFIIHVPEHPQHSRVSAYVSALRHHFPGGNQQAATHASSNNHLSAAFSFLLAILPASLTSLNAQTGEQTSILHTKEHLHKSVNAARSAQNTLIVTLCLNWMNHSLFRGIVGQQALQGAQIAKSTADQAGLDVWKDVSGQVLEETIARDQGMMFDSSFDMVGTGGMQGWGF